MGRGEAMIIAGLGFSSRCEGHELAELVRRAEALTALRAERLAAPVWKLQSPALQSASQILALPITAISEIELEAAGPRCITASKASQARAGIGSVAEAAALAGAGRAARLALPRIASAHATCALSYGDPS
jgi:cobalt-precorrin 5A hydrolase